VKAIDSHCSRLKPFLDVVAVIVIEMSAEIVPNQRGQLARAVGGKFSVIELMNFSELVKERRRGVSPTTAVHVDVESTF